MPSRSAAARRARLRPAQRDAPDHGPGHRGCVRGLERAPAVRPCGLRAAAGRPARRLAARGTRPALSLSGLRRSWPRHRRPAWTRGARWGRCCRGRWAHATLMVQSPTRAMTSTVPPRASTGPPAGPPATLSGRTHFRWHIFAERTVVSAPGPRVCWRLGRGAGPDDVHLGHPAARTRRHMLDWR